MKMPPTENFCPRWSQSQKGQQEERVAFCYAMSQLKQLISKGDHCALVSHLLHGNPFLTHLALMLPYTTVLQSKGCKCTPYDLMLCWMGSAYETHKERESQQNSSNKLQKDSYCINGYTYFCSKSLTISLVYVTPYPSLGQIKIKINLLILDQLRHPLSIWHLFN